MMITFRSRPKYRKQQKMTTKKKKERLPLSRGPELEVPNYILYIVTPLFFIKTFSITAVLYNRHFH